VATLAAYYTLNRTLTHMLKIIFSRPTAIDGPTAGKHYKYGGDDDISIAESTDISP